jgi:hypothetical protein
MKHCILGICIFFGSFGITHAVVINEIGWMGTQASSNDEWVELFNNSLEIIDLTNWTLEAQDGSPKIDLSGTIQPQSFFVLERTDDNSIVSIKADQIYSGSLSNSGEHFVLKDDEGIIQDEILTWYAGNNDEKKSMERINESISGIIESNWQTFLLKDSEALDAKGNMLLGTPGSKNSVQESQPSEDPLPEEEKNSEENNEPTSNEETPIDIVINEIEYNDDWIEIVCLQCPDEGVSLNQLAIFKNQSSSTFLKIDSEKKLQTNDTLLIFLRQGTPGETNFEELISGGRLLTIYSKKTGLASRGLLRLEHESLGELHRLSWKQYPDKRFESFIYQEDQNHTWTAKKTPGTQNVLQVPPKIVEVEDKPPVFKTLIPKQHLESIRINEIFMNPKGADSDTEFIELINTSASMINISGWKLDDIADGGSKPFTIPDNTFIFPKSFYIWYQKDSGINLNNDKDSVRFLTPDEVVIDKITYTKAKEDHSFNRTVSTSFEWSATVTPGKENNITAEESLLSDSINPSDPPQSTTSIIYENNNKNAITKEERKPTPEVKNSKENNFKDYKNIEEIEILSEIEKNTKMYKYRLYSQKGLVIKGKTIPSATIFGQFYQQHISTVSKENGSFEIPIGFNIPKGLHNFDIEIIASNGDNWQKKSIQQIELTEDYIAPKSQIKSTTKKKATTTNKKSSPVSSVAYKYKNVRAQPTKQPQNLQKNNQPSIIIKAENDSTWSWKTHEMILLSLLIVLMISWILYQWKYQQTDSEHTPKLPSRM